MGRHSATQDSRARNMQIARDRLVQDTAHLPVAIMADGYRVRVDCVLCGWSTTKMQLDVIEDHAATH